MASKTSRSGKIKAQPPAATLIGSVAHLGEVVHAQRRASGATLETAAGLAGVGVRFLLELEHGKQTASLGKALQVAQRMGLELWVVPRGKRPAGL